MCRGRGPAPLGAACSIASGVPDAAGTVAAAVDVTRGLPAECTVVEVIWNLILTLVRRELNSAITSSLVEGRI